MTPTDSAVWQKLAKLAKTITQQPLSQLLKEQNRQSALCLSLNGCRFDFTKQRISLSHLPTLERLAESQEVHLKRDAMLAGAHINNSEDRAALHTALRGSANLADPAIEQEIQNVCARMYDIADRIRSGQWRGHTDKPISDIVHIGIGGSHLGPQLVVEALVDWSIAKLNIHFVANIDATDLERTLKTLSPETTLFIIASKSFSTVETQVNARSARSWFLERGGSMQDVRRHFLVITNNIDAAAEFGLPEANLLPMWDWVGGRFSLWSTVGLAIVLKIGAVNHKALLAGAKTADDHFKRQPTMSNVPMLQSLLATWNYNFLGAASLVVLSYDERLRLLPNFLQQLEMESNGKSVDLDGNSVNFHTMPILWGGTGTNGQHAYHQLLHQGTRAYTADFIVVGHDDRHKREHHDWLVANALAQSQAMAEGFQSDGQPHRDVAGNHPSTVITLPILAPHELGTLLAVYEHKVFCQAAIWNINAFDQWGVELGKNLAEPIYAALSGDVLKHAFDPSTAELIKDIKKPQNPL